MKKHRSVITHLAAFAGGGAIVGPLVMAYGHTVRGVDAADWLNLPISIVGVIIGAVVTYALQSGPTPSGGRAAVLITLRELAGAARRAAQIDPDRLPDEAVLQEALAVAKRLTGAADRYQFARALTPPDEIVGSWIDIDAAVLELKSGLRDADRALQSAAAAHGPDFLRGHLKEVRDRFGEPLARLIAHAS